jgi:hypothetical protein
VSPISPSATIASNCESSGPGVVSETKTQSEYYTEMMPVTFSDHASTNADHDLRSAPAISTGTRRRNNLDVTGGGRRGQEGGGEWRSAGPCAGGALGIEESDKG